MKAKTRVYKPLRSDPNGLIHTWVDKSTGCYIAGFKTEESALIYRSLHLEDGNKWIVPHKTGK